MVAVVLLWLVANHGWIINYSLLSNHTQIGRWTDEFMHFPRILRLREWKELDLYSISLLSCKTPPFPLLPTLRFLLRIMLHLTTFADFGHVDVNVFLLEFYSFTCWKIWKSLLIARSNYYFYHSIPNNNILNISWSFIFFAAA